jgi:hypothetical protein
LLSLHCGGDDNIEGENQTEKAQHASHCSSLSILPRPGGSSFLKLQPFSDEVVRSRRG